RAGLLSGVGTAFGHVGIYTAGRPHTSQVVKSPAQRPTCRATGSSLSNAAIWVGVEQPYSAVLRRAHGSWVSEDHRARGHRRRPVREARGGGVAVLGWGGAGGVARGRGAGGERPPGACAPWKRGRGQ